MQRMSERGNAIVFILIAVALFAMLAFSFMRSAKTGQGNLSAGQAKFAAEEIINYAVNVERAIDKLRQQGCSETQITLQSSVDAGAHVNASAPVSKECHVFDVAGGKMTAVKANENWYTYTHIADYDDYFWFTSSDEFQDVGTTCGLSRCAELAMTMYDIKKEICDALNQQIGNNFTTIPSSTLCWDPFNGAFECGTGTPPLTVFTDVNLRGKKAACYNDTVFGYSFAYILLER